VQVERRTEQDEEHSFDEAVRAIAKQIASANPAEKKEWLRVIYTSRNDRFLSDNGRIWLMASIFVPLSFAPFAALAVLDEPSWPRILALAGSSILLYASWNVF
jgi:hypothetical protein